MTEIVQREKGSIENSLYTRPEYAAVAGLIDYDQSISERADNVLSGHSPNGHHPNGTLSEAISTRNEAAERKFIKEYLWALAVTVHPYSSQEPKDTLLCAASDALFIAGETYDPELEPNFLTHMSSVVASYIEGSLDLKPQPAIVPADSFDAVVAGEHLSQFPSFANNRGTSAFAVGSRVLFLLGKELVDGQIVKAAAYTNAVELGDSRVSPEETERIDAISRKSPRLRESDRQRLRDGLGSLYEGVVARSSPGFVHITSFEDPAGIITDMNRNTVITPDEWAAIKQSSLYKMLWLVSGSKESLRQSEDLEYAIARRIASDNHARPKTVYAELTPGRARPRVGDTVQLNSGSVRAWAA